jgi:hypothetical protein
MTTYSVGDFENLDKMATFSFLLFKFAKFRKKIIYFIVKLKTMVSF